VSDSDIQEQLTKYLTDAHSIEEQALQQLRAAPGIAGDPQLAKVFATTGILSEERRAAERVAQPWGQVVDASPPARGVAT
jgi:ferritin-like metal-binding protein YciE